MTSFDHNFVILKVSLHQASFFMKILYITDSPFPIKVYFYCQTRIQIRTRTLIPVQ